MKRLAILIGAVVILGGGGFLTAILAQQSITEVLPFMQQTSDPRASTSMAESWQIEQLMLLIGFIVFNMVGIGATIAVILWFLSRGVTEARAMPGAVEVKKSQEAA